MFYGVKTQFMEVVALCYHNNNKVPKLSQTVVVF